mmetsp:Transcript_19301/g.3137  ORF Transcript_19301/g.3137 Transcript_19301/m.3137 type:complete len:108 (-) Transcript_19301:1936-2259(-)
MAPVSWIAIAVYIPEEHVDRRLLEFEGNDFTPSLVFVLIVCAIGFLAMCNVMFMGFYWGKVARNDASYSIWRRFHKCNAIFTPLISLFLCFHCIRFLICSFCNLGAC